MVTEVEPKESKRQAWMIAGALIVFFLFCAAAFNAQITIPLALASPEGTPTVRIKIHRIQAIDAIEGFLQDGADWSYTITMWDGEKWVDVSHDAEGNHDDITVDKTHSFKVEAVTTTFYIILLERDSSAWEVADISSHSGPVKGDQRVPPPRGAMYEGIYNLKDNSLTGDKTYIEEGYYKTSGDYDGSTGIDENDANLWFAIWDNYEPPEAHARALNPKVLTYDKVNFDGSASKASDGSTIVKYEWDFDGDGVIDAEGEKTSYAYSTPGKCTVTLRVTDNLGETDLDTCLVTISNRPPMASFSYSPSKPTIRDMVHFTDTSTDRDGTITSWYWEFGDGGTSEERNPTHKYADKGTYMVKLTVTDDYGAKIAKTQRVEIVNIPPTAGFTYFPSSPVAGEDIQFTDKSLDPEEKLVAWLWDFGDGYTSSKRNPDHKYEDGGEYTVKLTVTDDEGATDTASITIIVEKNIRPIASFTFSPTEPTTGKDVQFTDKSEDPDGTIVSWRWEFGDGGTSTEQNPTHKYEEAGTYAIKLMVTDNRGATATVSETLVIKEAPAVPPPMQLFYEQPWIPIMLGLIVAVIIIGVTVSRRKGPTPTKATVAREEKPPPPEEIKFKPPVKVKLELEKERITEMLKAFKEKYEKGEISEEAYKKLKSKYEEKLKEIERQL